MLKTRVISGIVLVLIALATLITGGYVLLGVTYFLAICSFTSFFIGLYIIPGPLGISISKNEKS